jgi:uncharacterized protein involved in tolerance to divalent cations
MIKIHVGLAEYRLIVQSQNPKSGYGVVAKYEDKTITASSACPLSTVMAAVRSLEQYETPRLVRVPVVRLTLD